MPKMKTHSSAKKRFKVTGSGKINRKRANVGHLKRRKSNKSILRNRHADLVHKGDEPRVKRMLCIG